MSPRSNTGLSSDEPGTARARGILAAWWSGWRAALGMPGILILEWSVNLSFAAAAVLPTALLLSDHLAHSAIGEQVFQSMGTDIAAEFALAAWPQLRLAEILTEDAAGPQPLFYLTWLHWALLLLLGSWVARVYDYARIAAFLQPGGSARRAILRALAFTLRRGTKTLVLWLLLVVPAPALTALLATTSLLNGVETTGAMCASVALGQALLLLRILGSFAALGGQMRFMSRFQRP